jgi:hypothetical protein
MVVRVLGESLDDDIFRRHFPPWGRPSHASSAELVLRVKTFPCGLAMSTSLTSFPS